MKQKEIKKDEWAIVLDFLSHGHYGMDRSQPMAQVLGESFFSLLEVIVRDEVKMKSEERVYIGDGKRKEVKYIRGRLEIKDLTVAAKEELNHVIENIVRKTPGRFLDFFNKSGHITTRLHQLELLPGIGKKHLWAIIDTRKEKEFDSFDDIKKRVTLLPDPEKMIVKRILDELEDKDRFRIFVPRIEKGRKQY
jgi:putative nucleotide binding protein